MEQNAGTVVVCWFLTQEIVGSNNMFAIIFYEFYGFCSFCRIHFEKTWICSIWLQIPYRLDVYLTEIPYVPCSRCFVHSDFTHVSLHFITKEKSRTLLITCNIWSNVWPELNTFMISTFCNDFFRDKVNNGRWFQVLQSGLSWLDSLNKYFIKELKTIWLLCIMINRQVFISKHAANSCVCGLDMDSKLFTLL